MNNISLSVIIPIYNGERFLKWQLEVIAKQNYNQIEVIFVDNNSTDNSIDIIQAEIERKYWPFEIILLKESKQGAGAARNAGLMIARGKYVTFLDVDDEILSGKWKKEIPILEENQNIDFIFCRTKRVYKKEKREILHDISGFSLGINKKPQLGILWARNYFKIQNTSSTIIRKEAAIEINGFEESVLIGEDAMFFIKLGYEYNGYFTGDVDFIYYKHPTSTTVQRNKLRSAALDNFMLKKTCIIPYFESKSRKDMVKEFRIGQIFLLRQLLIEGILSFQQVKEEFKNNGVYSSLAKVDFWLVNFLRIKIPVRINPFLFFLRHGKFLKTSAKRK